MSVQVQRVIETVRAFPISDQIEVLQAISANLQHNHTLAASATEFWQNRSIEELAQMQSVPVITDISALAADFWPDDESADEFNDFVAARRRADREATWASYYWARILTTTSDRAKIEWMVRAGEGGTVKLVARHERAGVMRVEVVVGE